MRGSPMLDPARDLAGATPEKLARALFRRAVPYQERTLSSSAKRDRERVSSAKSSRTSDAEPIADPDAA